MKTAEQGGGMQEVVIAKNEDVEVDRMICNGLPGSRQLILMPEPVAGLLPSAIGLNEVAQLLEPLTLAIS